MKRCSQCEKLKNESEFSFSKRDGILSRCKKCIVINSVKWLKEHPDKREYWYKRNKKKIAQKSKKYYRENKNKILKSQRLYYLKNKSIINEKQRVYANSRRRSDREEVLIKYGGNPPKCSCCGESEKIFLTLDHVYGNGNKHKNEIGVKGTGLYIWAKQNNFPLIFKVLCFNCNCGKYRNKGICPHEEKEK